MGKRLNSRFFIDKKLKNKYNLFKSNDKFLRFEDIMKRTFYQSHFLIIIEDILYLCLTCAASFPIIVIFRSAPLSNLGVWLLLPVFVFMGIYFLLGCVNNLYNRIIFYEDRLLATGHFLKEWKIQYKSEIYYSSIREIKLVFSSRNSQRQSVKRSKGAAPESAFFELFLENGKRKWIYVSRFSKKQRQSILKLLNEKTGLNISYEELLANKYYYTYKKAKKD